MASKITLCAGNSRLISQSTYYPNFYGSYELYLTDFNADRSKANLRLKIYASWANVGSAKENVKIGQFAPTHGIEGDEGHDMTLTVWLPLLNGNGDTSSDRVVLKPFINAGESFNATASKDANGQTMAWNLTIDRVVAEDLDMTKYHVGKLGSVSLWDGFSFCAPSSYSGADYGPYLYFVPSGTEFGMPAVKLEGGTVHICDGNNNYDEYQIYIYNASESVKAWELYRPYIYNASVQVDKWEAYC